ncbi:EAL domain-containing protein [uncultured Paraglaciecola sp.]|uniref:bifunctional diguanylate cyclase/phosphodiesterase n=1 Tax=uncultured Paraglaciecola sp. TaxID=1765024 RepID=UPI0025FD1025|nr:EAL domain-containing protein [uncultured Paraglaciecola sp.]
MSWPVANGGSHHVSLRPTLLYALLVGFAFYLGCKLGLALATPTDKIATFFPANAIVLAALLLTDQRRWWAYLLVMVLADITLSMEYDLLAHRVVLFSIANFLEALVAAVSLRYLLASPIKLEQISEMLRFFLAVLVSGSFSACVASAVTFFEALELSYWSFWRAWFLSDTIGLLIVTPLIILGFQAGPSWLKSVKFNRTLEALGLALCLFIVSYYALGAEAGVADNFPALLYAPLPFLLWAAIRFNGIGVYLAILVITIFSVGTAASGLGPFTSSSPIENVLSVQFYLIATAVPIMLLSAVLSQYRLTVQEKNNAIVEKERLLQKLKRAASVFSSAHESIIITDNTATITEVNDAFSYITGYSPDDVLGKNPRILQSGRQSPEFYVEMWNAILTKGHWHGEIWNRRKNGDIYPEMMTINAVESDAAHVQHYISVSTDITDIKTYQGQLEHIAHFDPLTNLPNRILLADRLRQAIMQCQRRNLSLSVVFLDLDGFKAVNDRHGHNVGDELLIEVSHRMKETLREGDTLARIGGDEFIAVMIDLEKLEDSEPMLERLLKSAAYPIIINGIEMQVSASIGVAFYPQDGVTSDQLMRRADQAMYAAKQAGKNRYHHFDIAQDNAVKIQLENIDNIRTALDKSEFVMHFQPKVNMRTSEVIGLEALIRWQHPVRGLIASLEFLSAIEGHAISLEMGEWVMGAALRQISQWRSIGINLPISVNISAYQLQQDNFAKRLAALLSAHPEVPPHRLELEILETSVLSDINRVSAAMNACHDLSVRFALDDFGTGYSSLDHLRHLPAHMIKIDQSFVRDMLDDADDLAIVKGVVGLAKAFQRDVIAEGVETIAHGVALLQLGCELAQGYAIARPMPAADIPQWLDTWKPHDPWQAKAN